MTTNVSDTLGSFTYVGHNKYMPHVSIKFCTMSVMCFCFPAFNGWVTGPLFKNISIRVKSLYLPFFFYQQYSSTAWSFTFTLTAIYGVVFSSRIQNSNLNLLSLTQTSQGHLWLKNEKILQTEKWVYPTLYQSNIKYHLRNQI